MTKHLAGFSTALLGLFLCAPDARACSLDYVTANIQGTWKVNNG